ncbi:MAG TPA: serine/threonine-protein kinase [Acidobacteriota bacterium]
MQTIGRYQIEEILGQGAMGVVYRCHDPKLGRPVAIKVIAAPLVADASIRSRFLSEARSAARLNHPNIVTVFDCGEDGPQLFIAMEYFPGRDLTDLLPELRRWSLPRRLGPMIQVAEALQHAHERGIVHRDIKPANIRVGAAEWVKLMDFGIAKLGEVQLTHPGHVMGTSFYIAPELLGGADAVPASDLYSFGVVLYELLTGALPFSGDSFSRIAYQTLHERPLPPRELEPTIPPALEALTLRCLNKDPAARWDSARELCHRLRALRDQLERAPGTGDAAAGGTTADLRAARDFLQRGQLERCHRLLLQMLERDPSDAAARELLEALRLREKRLLELLESGRRHLAEHNFERSHLLLTEALELCPEHDVVQLELTRCEAEKRAAAHRAAPGAAGPDARRTLAGGAASAGQPLAEDDLAAPWERSGRSWPGIALGFGLAALAGLGVYQLWRWEPGTVPAAGPSRPAPQQPIEARDSDPAGGGPVLAPGPEPNSTRARAESKPLGSEKTGPVIRAAPPAPAPAIPSKAPADQPPAVARSRAAPVRVAAAPALRPVPQSDWVILNAAVKLSDLWVRGGLVDKGFNYLTGRLGELSDTGRERVSQAWLKAELLRDQGKLTEAYEHLRAEILSILNEGAP